jgi:hypothetical protein
MYLEGWLREYNDNIKGKEKVLTEEPALHGTQ